LRKSRILNKLNAADLLEKDHFLKLGKISCNQSVEIDSARQLFRIEFNFLET